jgi:hypothetical protein
MLLKIGNRRNEVELTVTRKEAQYRRTVILMLGMCGNAMYLQLICLSSEAIVT